jgi:hypothetical protein
MHSVALLNEHENSIAYSHHHGTNHYGATNEDRWALHSCLKHLRDGLAPARLPELCHDARAMTLRFIGIIDFLNGLGSRGGIVRSLFGTILPP